VAKPAGDGVETLLDRTESRSHWSGFCAVRARGPTCNSRISLKSARRETTTDPPLVKPSREFPADGQCQCSRRAGELPGLDHWSRQAASSRARRSQCALTGTDGWWGIQSSASHPWRPACQAHPGQSACWEDRDACRRTSQKPAGSPSVSIPSRGDRRPDPPASIALLRKGNCPAVETRPPQSRPRLHAPLLWLLASGHAAPALGSDGR
jgi:hypothetical protein